MDPNRLAEPSSPSPCQHAYKDMVGDYERCLVCGAMRMSVWGDVPPSPAGKPTAPPSIVFERAGEPLPQVPCARCAKLESSRDEIGCAYSRTWDRLHETQRALVTASARAEKMEVALRGIVDDDDEATHLERCTNIVVRLPGGDECGCAMGAARAALAKGKGEPGHG